MTPSGESCGLPSDGNGSPSLPPLELLNLGEDRVLSPIERAVVFLASEDDGGKRRDGAGFSREDGPIGRALAEKIARGETLDDEEKREAARIAKKYKGQLKKAGLAESDLPTIKVRDASDVLSEEVPAPLVLLGHEESPILTNEDLGVLHAREGLGKSWLALLLAFLLAAAIAGSAGAFLGIPIIPGGASVVLVTAELSLFRFRKRLLRLADTLPRGRFHVLVEGDIGGLDLVDEAHVDVLAAAILAAGANLLILDPLAELWTGEEVNRDWGRLLKNLRRLRTSAGCGILLIHHERKGPADGTRQGKGARDSDSFRGGSALRAGVRTALRLEEAQGLIRFAHTKSNLGACWPERWLEMSEPWNPRVVDAPPDPKRKRDGNLEAIVGILAADPERRFTVAEIRKAEGCPAVKDRTLTNYLATLVVKERITSNGGHGPHCSYRFSNATEPDAFELRADEDN